jgi:hypothetical protein
MFSIRNRSACFPLIQNPGIEPAEKRLIHRAAARAARNGGLTLRRRRLALCSRRKFYGEWIGTRFSYEIRGFFIDNIYYYVLTMASFEEVITRVF